MNQKANVNDYTIEIKTRGRINVFRKVKISAPIEIDVDVKGREGIRVDQCVDENINVNNDVVNIENFNNVPTNYIISMENTEEKNTFEDEKISYFSHANNTFEVYSEKKHLNEHAKLKDILRSIYYGNKNAATYTHRRAMHVHIPSGENDLVHNVEKERKYSDIPSRRSNGKSTIKNDHNLHRNDNAGSSAKVGSILESTKKERKGNNFTKEISVVKMMNCML
ncbi:hypothetical protein POVCU2_0086620 [Plasmodium ovale curtisi]|uniref:Uncharacterized protein n=1 Tax=Plasmodium ovale curtisi TaxID=864141 RepID=A0A1A8WMU5_PLAOA|nr:hypothetical protein POVCU2_0086620 [Plasmodium ovale curtisi]SBT00993.1 hypothetical protein POVCU1_063860 [Plasmodium ovale curtisi]